MAEFWVVLLAGLAAWMAGALWYGLLGPKWVAALGTTKAALARPKGWPSAQPFVLSFVADVVMAWVLALVMLGTAATGVRQALSWAVVLWLGFVLTTIATNNAYAKRQPMLTLIDAGHWAFALMVAAVVLGSFV